MYDKISAMQHLVDQGLNVHRFFIPESYFEYCMILDFLKKCTIRTDHENKTENLPFYIFDKSQDSQVKMDSIWNDARNNEYKLIISDGIKYDDVQEYNMVVKFQQNGDFSLEASELKIPLRHMYRYPLLSCDGNIASHINSWWIFNQTGKLNLHHIKSDLVDLYTFGIHNHWLEVTKYPIPVGIKSKNWVFWQVI